MVCIIIVGLKREGKIKALAAIGEYPQGASGLMERLWASYRRSRAAMSFEAIVARLEAL
jgi:hypothetical protein